MKENQKSKNWYDALPWWGWLLAGFFTLWFMGYFFPDATGFLPAGIGLFGLFALAVGVATGIARAFRKKPENTEQNKQ